MHACNYTQLMKQAMKNLSLLLYHLPKDVWKYVYSSSHNSKKACTYVYWDQWCSRDSRHFLQTKPRQSGVLLLKPGWACLELRQLSQRTTSVIRTEKITHEFYITWESASDCMMMVLMNTMNNNKNKNNLVIMKCSTTAKHNMICTSITNIQHKTPKDYTVPPAST
jgi:hypothetical protein